MIGIKGKSGRKDHSNGKTSGRKNEGKNKRMFGYKYTEDEYNQMTEALNKYKEIHQCTTSKALYDIIINCIK